VAEYLLTLAANYLELAERALRLRQPATAVRRQAAAPVRTLTTTKIHSGGGCHEDNPFSIPVVNR
jgi:hypothetical protein